MENIDKTYCVELNFVDEFILSRNGMILEIKTEFDIIRLCLQEISRLDKMYFPMLDRIVVHHTVNNYPVHLPAFPIAQVKKPQRSHRYACVFWPVQSKKHSA